MISFLKRLFRPKPTVPSASSAQGFTLIELLVSLVIGSIVITSLLAFVVDVMNNDRREQAKATTEQELQAALDYIARDLQQAIYIYDATGIAAIRSQLPQSTATDRFPVLVFWKRESYGRILPTSSSTDTGDTKLDNAFAYSLVAYYLIKDTDTNCRASTAIWSCAARIGRVQLTDSVASEFYSSGFVTGYDSSPGFKRFDLTLAGTLQEKMNQWTSRTGVDSNDPASNILIDYIDWSTANVPSISCPSGTQQVPQYSGTGNSVADSTLRTASFYACVDSSNTSAQIVLRGNAMARTMASRQIRTNALYSDRNSPFFPTASARVTGRGFLYTP